MVLTVFILFTCTLVGGLSLYALPNLKDNLGLPLVFAGSYLFAITVIHIIPELFFISSNPSTIGLYILIGFFIQQFLEYFSSGVEHGHFHADKAISISGRFSIVIALFIHSLLEGSLLVHDSPYHHEHESHSLLLGIILHKMPAAFALMVTLQHLGKRAIYLLVLFSIASPLGLVITDFVMLSQGKVVIVFGIVGGSFLHISTTIFVEASPKHHFRIKKILISLLGASLAILVEYFI